MTDASPQQEEWRKVPGFAFLEASSLGRVRRSSGKNAGLVFKQIGYERPNAIPYLRIFASENSVPYRVSVHKAVCLAFHGPQPSPKHVAAHNDGNHKNNLPGNLRWATPKENSADAINHGTLARGERSGAHKLTEERVREIRRLLSDGVAVIELSRRFGIQRGTIRFLRDRKTWNHVV